MSFYNAKLSTKKNLKKKTQQIIPDFVDHAHE